MCPVCQDGGFETADHGVGYHADGQQVNGCDGVHPRQGVDGGASADDQHERNEDVGHQAEDHEDDMGQGAEAGADDFEEGMRIGGSAFEFDGEGREEEDLDGGARGVPKGTGDAVAVADAGGLEESGGPGPGGDDGGTDETGFDGAAGRVEHFGRLELAVVSFEDECDENHAW